MKYVVLIGALFFLFLCLGSILLAGKAEHLGSYWQIESAGWVAFAWVVGAVDVFVWIFTLAAWDK